jgi:hypothetical protein
MNNEILDLLKSRNESHIKENQVVFHDGKLKYMDPGTKLVGSDDSLMYHEFIISTPDPDRVGDVVNPKGCLGTINNYKKNPIIFYNHSTESFPIAKAENPLTGEFCVNVGDVITSKAFFHCRTEVSEKCYELIKLKYLNNASIGFNPIEMAMIKYEHDKKNQQEGFIKFPDCGFYIKEWDMLEWSVVGTACNPKAVGLKFDIVGFKSWLSKNYKEGNLFYKSLKETLPVETSITVPVTGIVLPDEKKIEPVVETTIKEIISQEEKESYFEKLKAEFMVKFLESDEYKNLIKELTPVQNNVESKDPVISVVEPVVETITEEKPKKKEPPVGVKLLNKIIKGILSLKEEIEEKLSQVDNKKTEQFILNISDGLKDIHKEAVKYGRRNYTDHFDPDKDIDSLIVKEDEAYAIKLLEEDKMKKNLLEEKQKQETVSKQNQDEIAKLKEQVEKLTAIKKSLDDKVYSLIGK